MKIKNCLVLTLILSMMFGVISVNAAPTVNDDGTNYNISGEEGDTTEQDVEVTLSKGSSFKVCVPKKVEIASDTDSVYKIGVWGDVAPNQKIVVEPIDTTGDGDSELNFILKNDVAEGVTAKSDVKGVITPIKTEWAYNDTDLAADSTVVSDPVNHVEAGSISASLTAGAWSGTFTLRISLQDV